jgi:hypothetical protein
MVARLSREDVPSSPLSPCACSAAGCRSSPQVAPVDVRQSALEGSGARDAPVALARAGPLAARSLGDPERAQVAPPRAVALPLLPAHLPETSAEPLVEVCEGRGVSAYAKYAVQPTVKRLSSRIRRSIETPRRREASSRNRSLARAGFRIDSHLDLTVPLEETEAQEGPCWRSARTSSSPSGFASKEKASTAPTSPYAGVRTSSSTASPT